MSNTITQEQNQKQTMSSSDYANANANADADSNKSTGVDVMLIVGIPSGPGSWSSAVNSYVIRSREEPESLLSNVIDNAIETSDGNHFKCISVRPFGGAEIDLTHTNTKTIGELRSHKINGEKLSVLFITIAVTVDNIAELFDLGTRYPLDDSLKHEIRIKEEALKMSHDKYVISAGDKSVELSTDQCLIMDSYTIERTQEPYILLNESGVELLEQLGPIDTLRVRIGSMGSNKEDTVTSNHYGKEHINKEESSYVEKLFELYADLMRRVEYLKRDSSSEKMTLRDREYIDGARHYIENVLMKLKVKASEKDREQREGMISEAVNDAIVSQRSQRMVVRAWNGTRWFFGQFFSQWLFGGLLINICGRIAMYLLKSSNICLLLYRLGIWNEWLFGLVFLVDLFEDNMLQIIEKLGEEGGVPYALRVHALLVLVKGTVVGAVQGVLESIVSLCLVEPPLQWPAPLRLALRCVLDAALLLLTALPPVYAAYVRVRQQQQQQQPQIQH